jgi:hypothetical protein
MERPQLEVATSQRLGKTEVDFMCAVVTVIFGVRNSRSYMYLRSVSVNKSHYQSEFRLQSFYHLIISSAQCRYPQYLIALDKPLTNRSRAETREQTLEEHQRALQK